MRRRSATIGSAAWFAVAPGVVAGLLPWWLTRWEHLNPIPYGQILASTAGQSIVLARVESLWYLLGVLTVTLGSVHLYEELALRRTFGAQDDAHTAAVPASVPRLRRAPGGSDRGAH